MKIKNIYFSSGGIHALYMYVGAIRILHKNKHKLEMDKLRLYGCSAGAGFAFFFMLVMYDIITVDDIEKELDNVFDKPNIFSFDLTPISVKILEFAMSKYVRDKIILDIANKHLYIGISFINKFFFVHKFNSHYDLLNVIMLSGTLPFLSSYIPCYNDNYCLDGGIQFKMNQLPKKTFVVYNLTYFPDSCVVPKKCEKQQLIEYGIVFTNNYLRHRNKDYYKNMFMNEYNYSDETVKKFFLLDKWLIRKDPKWNQIILEFLRLHQNGTSLNNGESHTHHIENYGDSPATR
jgi:hypothetical protein